MKINSSIFLFLSFFALSFTEIRSPKLPKIVDTISDL